MFPLSPLSLHLNPFGTWLRPTVALLLVPPATSPITPLWTGHLVALQLLSRDSWSGQQEAWQDHHRRVSPYTFGLSPTGLQLVTVNLHQSTKWWGKTLLVLPSITPCAFLNMKLETIKTFIRHLQLPTAWQALILLPSIQCSAHENVGWPHGDDTNIQAGA